MKRQTLKSLAFFYALYIHCKATESQTLPLTATLR